MAVRETPFQSELVTDMTNAGMHAFKASHREKTGVVDLWCRHDDVGAWIECKFITIQPSFRTEKVSLTRPQWSFMGKELAAGGCCATIIGYRRVHKTGHDSYGLLLCDPMIQHNQVMRSWADDNKHAAHIVKLRGARWPADLIMSRINLMHSGMLPWAHRGREEQ